ncbi:MAG: bifunctional response regulator/alkaline phosphatase family protein [candidate division Zixibacteria bacterium]|nr:bifunctional response regulator/alkaline phosphatase family protein [candidate division Zixibacteria bacterium]
MTKLNAKKTILWVDDEIDSLKAHILFLEKKGLHVSTAMSGDDAIVKVQDEAFDLVLLDEMMPGKDGLTTLEEIKDIHPHLPVVMVTKSEEESLMDDAIGQKIDDYLVKPVNPSQVLLVIKRLLESKKIIRSSSMRRYISEINRFSEKLYGKMDPEVWHEAARILAWWNLELDQNKETGLEQMLDGTRREWNNEFTKYIENNYRNWLFAKKRPVLSPDVVGKYLIPRLKQGKKTLFIVVDCMRLDQWMLVEPMVAEYYNIQRETYFSLLPTATPFARNALFAGLFPDEINKTYPDNYRLQNEGSLNRNEEKLFTDNLARQGVRPERQIRYTKVYDNTESENLAKKVADYFDSPVVSFVFNFLDILVHGRSNNVILKEIAGTEAAFRSLMKSWFEHSPLFSILKAFAARDFTVVVTSDHGSILCKRGTLAHGKKSTSSNLRYKYGDNLKSDPKDSILMKKPDQWRLPMFSIATTYILAKEDFYFVYPNNYNEMVRRFQNSFQHGGISLEEMVVPLAILTPK